MPKPLPELRRFLDERDMPRRQLAAAMGYSMSTINAVFAGLAPVSFEFVGRFLVAFGPLCTVQVLEAYFPSAGREESAGELSPC